jgi:hypothetical protein
MIALLALLQNFTAVDVYVDSPKPLAAWQVEIRTDATIVGVEGGEPKAYAEPPFYDPKALQGGRIVLAAFTTDAAPPSGRIRVARLHLQERGTSTSTAREIVAAAPGGARLDAKVELVRVK